MEMKPSRQHFRQYYYEIRDSPLGAGAYGEVYLGVSKDKANALLAQSGKMSRTELHNALRAGLVAIKIPSVFLRHAEDTENMPDLLTEIHMMRNLLTIPHPRIIPHLGGYAQGSVQWLVTPYVTGGSLEDLAEKYSHAISLSFIWHLAAQVAEGLLFLQFGIGADGALTPLPGWPGISHGDIHAGNVLMRPSTGRFPDAVLADFGCGDYTLPGDSECDGNLRDRIVDINRLGEMLETFLDLAVSDDDPLVKIDLLMQWITRLATLPKDVEFGRRPTKLQIYCLLKDLVTVASRECETHYQPMPSDVLADIASSKVSDAELDSVFATCS